MHSGRIHFIRTSIFDQYSGSIKLLHTWIILVIFKQHLAQIGQVDGPIEYLSSTLAAIKSLDIKSPHCTCDAFLVGIGALASEGDRLEGNLAQKKTPTP